MVAEEVVLFKFSRYAHRAVVRPHEHQPEQEHDHDPAP